MMSEIYGVGGKFMVSKVRSLCRRIVYGVHFWHRGYIQFHGIRRTFVVSEVCPSGCVD